MNISAAKFLSRKPVPKITCQGFEVYKILPKLYINKFFQGLIHSPLFLKAPNRDCSRVTYSRGWTVGCRMVYFQPGQRPWPRIWANTMGARRCPWSTTPCPCTTTVPICRPPIQTIGHIIRYNHISLWVWIN